MPAKMATILVTGGSGYVGSHCVLQLLKHHFRVIVIDNLVNSVLLQGNALPESLARVERITGEKIAQFYNGSIEDSLLLDQIFQSHPVQIVIHFAALKAVGESVAKPLLYYRNNVSSSITLLNAMQKHGVTKFIFSSSATVYGVPNYLPLDEKHPTGLTCPSPYGRGKFIVEKILEDLCISDSNWSVISLRYFNPVGAHESGLIGEDPNDIPNNLMPFITQVAAGVRPCLQVFGNDYQTPDGTAIRDYIHIEDLATGHIAALRHVLENPESWQGYQAINLGTGTGTSVLQVVAAFEKATGVKIPCKIVDRRAGDVTALYGDAKLASVKLGWTATRSIEEMCASAWNWQSNNPRGYRTEPLKD